MPPEWSAARSDPEAKDGCTKLTSPRERTWNSLELANGATGTTEWSHSSRCSRRCLRPHTGSLPGRMICIKHSRKAGAKQRTADGSSFRAVPRRVFISTQRSEKRVALFLLPHAGLGDVGGTVLDCWLPRLGAPFLLLALPLRVRRTRCGNYLEGDQARTC